MQDFDILFSILTLPEVEFLAPISERFIAKGYNVGFILFHEAGRKRLKRANIPFFNIHELRQSIPYRKLTDTALEGFIRGFNIENIRDLYLHEVTGYNRRNESVLLKKVIHYLQIMDNIFNENKVKCVIQELGGFSSNHCVYYAAKKNKIDHVFYEPSAFSKRIVFNMNSYYSDIPDRIINDTVVRPETRKEVDDYVKTYLQKKFAVIPFKDKHSFADQTLRKVINIENLGKLKRKLFHKYILREREEYDEIGWVVKYSFIKLLRRLMLNFYYTKKIKQGEKYIYYPFHVPHDVQLTSRSRLFYYQEGFVEYLSRNIPYGYKLYLKEHPASVGGHSFWASRNLLKQYKNIKLIHPTFNSFDLISNASLIVTVNSKVGFEAIMQCKKVIVVGDAFYKNKGITYDVNNLNELGTVINNALASEPPSREKIMDFLAKAYKWSYPCELFLNEEENLEHSYKSFLEYLETEKFQNSNLNGI